ncbi:hypothetical protein BHM03_00011305 [Ensete ventricosum]|nr:hypothetical protein BHM03_00011305 [Ensete ventricosum]
MVGSRFWPSAIDFGGQQLIEGEINRQRWIKGEKGKKKKKKEEKKKEVPCVVLARAPTLPAGRPHAIAARGSPTSRRLPRPRAIFLSH